MRLAAVVVNGLYPPLEGLDVDPAGLDGVSAEDAEALRQAAAFRAARQQLQEEQVARLSRHLGLPQLHLPYLFSPELGPAEIETLAGALTDAVETLDGAAAP